MKIKAWYNVLKIILFVDVFLRVTGYILFIPAYILRTPLYWMRTKPVLKHIAVPLWIYLTNKDDLYGNEEECWRNIGVYPTNWWKKFIVAYYWNPLRNPNWNAYELIKTPTGDKTAEHVIYSNEYYHEDDQVLTVHKNPYAMCRAKFYYLNADGSHSESTNEGDYIDHTKSIFGRSLVYFKNNGKWWVTKSSCYIVTNPSWVERFMMLFKGKNMIREWNIGVFSRVLIRNKFQKFTDEK